MKFVYQYRTSDNVLHQGEINAPSREGAFTRLKKIGIRPSKLEVAPGILNNLIGRGKRWIAIAVLSTSVVVTVIMLYSRETFLTLRTIPQFSPMPRHQIYGDPALWGRLQRTDYKEVFEDEGCRMLAHFALPGLIDSFDVPGWESRMARALQRSKDVVIDFSPDDLREERELKQIVAGMLEELRAYLSDGIGTTELYVTRLVERQQREYEIWRLVKQELKKTKDLVEWEVKNDQLRELGLPTVIDETVQFDRR